MASMVAYKIISELGPMTAAELAEQLGTTVACARASIATCRSMGDRCRLYSLKYVDHAAGAKEYPRAVYAAGNIKAYNHAKWTTIIGGYDGNPNASIVIAGTCNFTSATCKAGAESCISVATTLSPSARFSLKYFSRYVLRPAHVNRIFISSLYSFKKL